MHIHYTGWDPKWDETIDTEVDGHRIRGATVGDEEEEDAHHRSRSISAVPTAHEDGTLGKHSHSQSRRHTLPRQSMTQIAENAFRSRMMAIGLRIVAMQADGNCLFRAVAHQVYLNEGQHLELRARCIEHMRRHAARFAVFCAVDFEDYLAEKTSAGVWGDDLELKALEELLDRLICIYSSESLVLRPMNTNFDEERLLREVPPVILSYHGKNHYNSVQDEKQKLPLGIRRSTVILDARTAAASKTSTPNPAI